MILARKQPRLKRYMQLWHQLSVVNEAICRTYCPSPHSSSVTVPVIPFLLQQQILHQVHDIPSAGHQGYLKTLNRLKEEAYWPGMAVDVQKYCQECSTCQTSKLPFLTPAKMVNTPIGNPWKMLAVDILEVPLSWNNHRYLLVVMDYFTNGVDTILLCDQKPITITDAVVKICSNFGMPEILHSDQCRNFKSTLFHQVLEAFGIHKCRTTAYHPQRDGMVEHLTAHCYNCSDITLTHKMTGNIICH